MASNRPKNREGGRHPDGASIGWCANLHKTDSIVTGWLQCTLPEGHDGDHKADGLDRWPSKSPPLAPGD